MKRFEIYTSCNFPGKFLVHCGQGGFGDTIHETLEDAERYAESTRKREEESIEREKTRIETQLATESMERKRLNLVNQYLEEKCSSNMVAGRIIKTLSVKMRYQFEKSIEVLHRHEAIERRVAEGWTFKDYSFGTKFASKDDVFSDINKTEEDYARWLIDREKRPKETN